MAATGCLNGKARLWDPSTGKPIGDPFAGGPPVLSLAFSPDGKRLLTGQEAGPARLWDVTVANPVAQSLDSGGSQMFTVGFSPDGKWCAGAWSVVRLWQLPGGALRATNGSTDPTNAGGPVFSFAFSPDGKQLLTTRIAGQVLLWDVPAGRIIHDLSGSVGLMTGTFSRDGRTCWVGFADGKVRAYDTTSGQSLGATMEHQTGILHIAPSPDGRTVLTWDMSGVACLWETKAAHSRGRHVSMPKGTRLQAFGPGGRTYATAADHTCQLWDSATHHPIGKPLRHPAAVQVLAYRPDGRVLLTGSADEQVRQWDTRTAQATGPNLHVGKGLQSLHWARGGSKVLSINGRIAQRWDAGSGVPLGKPFVMSGVFAFTDDGRVIRAESHGIMAFVKDAVTGQTLGPPVRQPAIIADLALMHDGKVVVTRGEATTHVREVATGNEFCPPLVHREIVRLLQPSPDSRRLLTGGWPGPRGQNFQLWEIASGRPVGPLIPAVRRADFSPDGKFFATAHGREVCLWEAESGKQVGPHLTNPGTVQTLDLSNGAAVLWVGGDGLHQWDLAASPIQGKAERITCWLETATGYYLDLKTEGSRRLSPDALKKRRQRFDELGGSPALQVP